MGQQADRPVAPEGVSRRDGVEVDRVRTVADVQVELAQQRIVVSFAGDAATGAKGGVVKDFVVDHFQAAVGKVAMAGHGSELAFERVFDGLQVAPELGADQGKAAAQHARVLDVVALGKGGHFLEVVARFAAVRFDLTHQAEVERGQAEVITGRDAVLGLNGEHLGGGAQVAVDVMAVHQRQRAGPLLEKGAHRELLVAGLLRRLHQCLVVGQAGGHQVVAVDAVEQRFHGWPHWMLYWARKG